MNDEHTRWHKNSRWWIAGTAVMLLFVFFTVAVLVWWTQFGADTIEKLFALAYIYMGGSAVKTGVGEFRKQVG